MRTKFRVIITLLLAFIVQLTFAQQKTVTGTVVDGDGLPIPGVNVIIKGTTTGTQTDFDGNFTIEASSTDVLEFSYTGMKTYETTVGNRTSITVNMEENLEALEEVVVVGYSKTTKESFTGTAAVVSTEDLNDKVVSNVTQAIRGEVAGVNVITRSGQPGSTAEIRIRGFGSVNGNSEPLYILDGAPLGRGGAASDVIASLNPSDIESFIVLKDAAATSIYGSRGANGVIQITTVQGKKGKSRIAVDFKTSVNTLFLPEYDFVRSPEDYIEISWQALRTNALLSGNPNPEQFASNNLYGTAIGVSPIYNIWNAQGNELINPATGEFNDGVTRRYTPTQFGDEVFGTGIRSEANLQMSGGNDKTTYAFSLGYVDETGFAVNSAFQRYNTRLNLQHKALDWLDVGANIAWAGSRATNAGSANSASSANPFRVYYTTPAIYDVFLRDEEGNRVPDPIFGGFQYDYGITTGRRAWSLTNAVGVATYDLRQTDRSTLLGNFNINAQITEWLSAEIRYSGQQITEQFIQRGNQFYGGAAESGGSLFVSDDVNTNQNFLQLLRFQKKYGNHDVELFVAHESTEDRFKRLQGSANNAILPGANDLNQYANPTGRAESFRLGWTLDSYFSGLNYDYDDTYFITASIRRDGTSRFANNKWGTFGSVGLGWIVTNEDFMDNFDNLDFLKLKASYGEIGDSGTRLTNGFQIFNINQDPDGQISYSPSNELGNPDLTWETSKVYQVGFESTWFDGKLGFDVDFYDRRTVDLLQIANLPASSGFDQSLYNSGSVLNQGIEFTINAKIVETKDFRFSVNLNGETFRNEVLEMPTEFGSDTPVVFDDNNNLAEGVSQFDWFMAEWAGVNPANGEALWYRYYDDVNNNGILDAGEATTAVGGGGFEFDADGDGINDNASSTLFEYQQLNPNANIQRVTTNNINSATNRFIGKSAIPDVRGGFRLNFGYKNFSLATQFSYSIGGYVYDAGYAILMDNDIIGATNFHSDIRDAWTTPGQITNVPRTSANFGLDSQQSRFSSRFLTKADYFSLNNVNLNYSFPKDLIDGMGIDTLNLFVAGDNLMMLSRRPGLNPTTFIATSDSGIYMPPTTFTVGARIQF